MLKLLLQRFSSVHGILLSEDDGWRKGAANLMFSDAFTNDRYAGAAAKYGLIKGSGGQLRPTDTITHGKAAVLLLRLSPPHRTCTS